MTEPLTEEAMAAATIAKLQRLKVRPLKWVNGIGSAVCASAFGIGVFYRITGQAGEWTLLAPGNAGYVTHEGFESQAAAKRAAEEDYKRRVTAAIEGT